jgi:outer membrane protein assembly factor BamB
MFCNVPDTLSALGVVPVVVGAGSALWPVIVAGLGAAFAVLANPRKLVGLCRRKPYVPVIVIAAGVGAWFAGVWIYGLFTAAPAQADQTSQAGPAAQRPAGDATNWADVARDIIRRRGSKGVVVEEQTPDDQADAAALVYRGGPGRCGTASKTGPRNLTQEWTHKDPFAMVLSSPLVADGAVYVADCVLDPLGSIGSIYCVDAATGEIRWRTRDDAGFKGFFSSPALSADRKLLVIGQGLHYDVDSSLVCVETLTGRLKWTVQTPLHIEGSPAIAGNIVVAGAGAVEGPAPDYEPKGNPGYVFAVDLQSGEELWRYDLADPESSPVIIDGIAYIGSGYNGKAVAALKIAPQDELDGERLVWKTDTPFPATGAVTAAGDMVLIGCGNGNFVESAPDPEGAVIALDRTSGKVRWQKTTSDAVLASIAVCDGVAYCPVRDGKLLALDIDNGGKVLWEVDAGDGKPLLTGPAVTEKTIYVVRNDGYLIVLDRESGEVLEDDHYVNAPDRPGQMGLCVSSPFVANGAVYIGSETGGLQCWTEGAE